MDNQSSSTIPNSFMPKQKLTYNLNQRKESIGLFTGISLILLTLSVIFFFGAWGYRYYLYRTINSPCSGQGQACGLKASVDLERQKLAGLNLAQYKKLDTKLKLSQQLFNEHDTLKPLFDLMGTVTVQNVQFKNLQFDSKGITLSGLAKSYQDIGVQAQALKQAVTDGKLASFSFGNFDLDGKGNVVFDLSLSVEPAVLNYVQANQITN